MWNDQNLLFRLGGVLLVDGQVQLVEERLGYLDLPGDNIAIGRCIEADDVGRLASIFGAILVRLDANDFDVVQDVLKGHCSTVPVEALSHQLPLRLYGRTMEELLRSSTVSILAYLPNASANSSAVAS